MLVHLLLRGPSPLAWSCSRCGGPTGRRGTSYARAPIAHASWHFDVDSVHPGDEAAHLVLRVDGTSERASSKGFFGCGIFGVGLPASPGLTGVEVVYLLLV